MPPSAFKYGALLAAVCALLPLSQGARLLHSRWGSLQGYDAATYTSIEGQQPSGLFSSGQDAEASSNGASRGVRYNGGRSVYSGDVYPGPRSGGTTGGGKSSSGNTPSEANINLGLQVVAATYEGARAAAGSGVLHSAESGGAVANNVATYRPGTTVSRGSVSYTDITPNAASVTGQGNGPVALAWGNEVGAMARSQKSASTAIRNHGDFWAAANAPGASARSSTKSSKSKFQKLTTCLSCRRLLAWL